jgi:hypothetical protein
MVPTCNRAGNGLSRREKELAELAYCSRVLEQWMHTRDQGWYWRSRWKIARFQLRRLLWSRPASPRTGRLPLPELSKAEKLDLLRTHPLLQGAGRLPRDPAQLHREELPERREHLRRYLAGLQDEPSAGA